MYQYEKFCSFICLRENTINLYSTHAVQKARFPSGHSLCFPALVVRTRFCPILFCGDRLHLLLKKMNLENGLLTFWNQSSLLGYHWPQG
uniref:Uncharacterized protein n=1 Tax=Rhizophora mucronata TaxID=61149 RepID=A0A2P2MM16_RHIMU